MSGFQGGFQTAAGGGGLGTAFPSAATFPHYAIQQGIPYNLYGYDTSYILKNMLFIFYYCNIYTITCFFSVVGGDE